MLSACGGGSSNTPSTNGDGGGSNNGNSDVTAHALATIEHGGGTVAYITYFSSANVGVYIPLVDRYAGGIRLANGSYVGGVFYWFGSNCTGTPITTGFTGELAKTVLYDQVHDAYYLVSSLISAGTNINYQSYSSGSICTNLSSSLTAYEGAANITVTTQPYNFSAIAPLTPKFQ